MKKNEIRKADYRLVARLRGDKLTMEFALYDGLRAEHLRAIERTRTAGAKRWDMNRMALARSVEWERFGDFLTAAGRMPGAIKAYNEAIQSCFEGEYYDHGDALYPSRWLQVRSFGLFDKALVRCGGDVRLKSLLCGDDETMRVYKRVAEEM